MRPPAHPVPIESGRPLSYSTRILTSIDELNAVEREWDELLDDSAQQAYFLRWAWNALWWQHFAPKHSQLRIVTCRDSHNRLIGLAPFYRREHRLLGVPHARELLFIGTGIELKTSEYLDIITRRGFEATATREIAAALNARADWDRICLLRVPSDSTVLPDFLAQVKGEATLIPFDSAPYIDTSHGWDEYKRRLGRSMRRNLEYYPRRLFKKSACEFRRIDDQAEFAEAFDALIRLHVSRWRSQGEVSALAEPAFADFLREAMARSLSDRRLRLWTLTIDGSIQGVLVGFVDRRILHYFQKGFNPDFGRDSVGTVLVSLCVKDCCEDEEIDAFDFMGGGAAYKAMWARENRLTSCGEIHRQNARVWAFSSLQRLRNMARNTYRRLTPMWLRSVRKEWLRARRLRELSAQSTHIAICLVSGALPLLE